MAYDFHNLTQSQQWLLTVGGWDMHTQTIARPSRGTVQPLIDRGLVVEHRMSFQGITVEALVVPIDVHMAWCEHCADHDPVNQPKKHARQPRVA